MGLGDVYKRQSVMYLRLVSGCLSGQRRGPDWENIRDSQYTSKQCAAHCADGPTKCPKTKPLTCHVVTARSKRGETKRACTWGFFVMHSSLIFETKSFKACERKLQKRFRFVIWKKLPVSKIGKWYYAFAYMISRESIPTSISLSSRLLFLELMQYIRTPKSAVSPPGTA